MSKTPDRSLRSDVDLARRAFDRWRRVRSRGTPIPEALWRMALELASKYGVSQASLALHLDYYAVKRRLTATGGVQTKPSTTEFVELSMPSSSHVGRCQVEIRDTLGDTLRIDVSGLCARDLATFVRAVAGREPCSR
jgi:hypothetical protein